ncbi:MAG TPA: hypothetical protein VFE47_09480 [Tepidisphaeraceae bacterium]|nr:hypothetical protein [Tepidisphaeraceae bacterium]
MSLAFCAGTGVLWVRSYWSADTVWRAQPEIVWKDCYRQRYSSLDSSCGRFYFFAGEMWVKPKEFLLEAGLHHRSTAPEPEKFIDDDTQDRFGRFGIGLGEVTYPSTPGFEVMLPHWVVCLGSIILPATWISVKYRARRRRKAGQCRACGYDLRATVERCPECGAPSVVLDDFS